MIKYYLIIKKFYFFIDGNKMIQHKTNLKIIDNSGAKTAKCIKVFGGYKKKQAYIGDIVLVAITGLKKNTNKLNIKKHTIFKAIIVKTKSINQKNTGFKLKFQTNDIILLNKQNNPIANRITDIIPRFFKNRFYKLLTVSYNLI